MPIIKNPNGWSNQHSKPTSHFVGRVLKIEKTSETRNWSDTMDVSDFRTTECTYALVWLGKRFVPPGSSFRGRVITQAFDGEKLGEWYDGQVRDLEAHEQFAWVDCTNIFADRCGYYLTAREDAVEHGLVGDVDTDMWSAYVEWTAWHEAAAKAEAAARAERLEADRVRAAAEAAKRAAREAKLAASNAKGEAAAKALLARVPAKGTPVTVDGVTGRVAWMGVKKYYGKWNARVGVKDVRGNMHWLDAAKLVA